MKSCIDVAVTRVGDGIHGDVSRVGLGADVAVTRVGGGIDFRCSLICTVGDLYYLRVEPETIWLLPDSAEVAVYSNVTWVVEY